MTAEIQEKCGHGPCTCAAVEGGFCGDFCRENVGAEAAGCGCGHPQCAGSIGRAETAVGLVEADPMDELSERR